LNRTLFGPLPGSAELISILNYNVGCDGSFGTAARYGFGRSGDPIPAQARFSATVQTGPGAHPASSTMRAGSFMGVKRPVPGVDHPPHPALGLEEE